MSTGHLGHQIESEFEDGWRLDTIINCPRNGRAGRDVLMEEGDDGLGFEIRDYFHSDAPRGSSSVGRNPPKLGDLALLLAIEHESRWMQQGTGFCPSDRWIRPGPFLARCGSFPAPVRNCAPCHAFPPRPQTRAARRALSCRLPRRSACSPPTHVSSTSISPCSGLPNLHSP
jgi:hypothetical protein